MERWRRRRRIIKSAIITFILIFSWIGTIVGMQMISCTAYNFRSETELVLERIRDGQAELVYREAAPRFRKTMILDRFLELSSDIRRTMGGFREILAIRRVESTSGPGGETGRVKTTLEFDRGRTKATFSYHKLGGQWRLLHLSIRIPDHLKADAISRSETRSVRVEAPAEVYALVKKTLEQVRDGQSGAVYDAAAPSFKQSVDRETFLRVQTERRDLLGPYLRILDTIKGTRNRSRSKARIVALVEYEKDKTTVVIGFIKIQDVWRLSYYKVEMPQIRLPLHPTGFE